MNKKALALVVDLLVDKYSERYSEAVEDCKNIDDFPDVEAAVEPLFDMMAVKSALKEDKYDAIWHAVTTTHRSNKKHKKKLKKLRHILDTE